MRLGCGKKPDWNSNTVQIYRNLNWSATIFFLAKREFLKKSAVSLYNKNPSAYLKMARQ